MKRIYLILIVLVGISVSCTKNFEDWQKDEKNPTEVPGEMLFTNAQKDLADQVAETNVNVNNWKLFAQHWTEVTYTNEANYDIISRTVADGVFRIFYRDILMDLKRARTYISAQVTVTPEQEGVVKNKLYIIDILEVYSYQRLVDIFGNIPYTQALDIDATLNPSYDDGLTIYKDLVARLDKDIAGLNTGFKSFDKTDLYYDGDVAAWKVFAYSLKARLGITIADADPAFAQSTFEAAAPNGFTSSDQNATLVYLKNPTSSTNPLWQSLVNSGRDDFVPANTIVDMMHELNDPRITAYFQAMDFAYSIGDHGEKVDTELEGEGKMVLIYTGFEGGDSLVQVDLPFTALQADSSNTFTYNVGGQYGYPSSFATHSHTGAIFYTETFPSTLMSYTEMEFYRAEAAARGWSSKGDAVSHYEAAITSSFADWGIDGAAEYIASEGVAWDGSGDWKKVIGTQAWLGFYQRGFEAWTTYRRLDWPVMNVPEAPETSDGGVPRRLTFPVNEQTLNKANYYQAAEAIGGDDMTTKVFWDKY